MTRIDRRSFLQAMGALPLWWSARSEGLLVPRGDDRTLVVLELVGGNDGLNTVIPTDDTRYQRLRPRLSAVQKSARALGNGVSLHGALEHLHAAITRGTGAVVQSVGYPKPDRSHVRSRDIWHLADPTHTRIGADASGWLGRAAEQLAAAGAGMPAASIGSLQVPLLLRSRKVLVPTVRRADDFQLLVDPAGDAAATRRQALAALIGGRDSGDLAASVAAIATEAVRSADQLREALQRYQPRAKYPDTSLGRDLQLLAQLSIAGFGTRLFHLGFGSFDTHARQLDTHAGLLQQLDGALGALLQDLHEHGRADRVVVLVHSEFGRRVAENQSQGTDHGAAAPVFVFGGTLRAETLRSGVCGPLPDLDDLDDGDLKPIVDFRSVYQELLRWTGLDPRAVLGGEFPAVGLFGS